MSRGARRAALAVSLACALAGCGGLRGPAEPSIPYRPDRRDYEAFRQARPDLLDHLLEPNYLPFMVHRIPGAGGEGDALVFCRWLRDDMPLPVYIEPPDIPGKLQNEFAVKDPGDYVAAVEAALAMWERELEGLVRFRRVETPKRAKLEFTLVASEGPAPDTERMVLGTTPVAGACSANDARSGATTLDVTFSVPEAKLYIADEFGLLNPDQVQWIALHEIGHALGMRRHSPIPADLMYEQVRDRISVQELSHEDVNSFVSLYRIDSGTVFGTVPAGEAESRRYADVPPPAGPPELALAPYVDSRNGFQVHPPAGWLRLETAQGMVAVDGLTWDYSASFQVIVQRYRTIEEFLERFGPHYFSGGWVLRYEFGEEGGFRSLEATVMDRDEMFIERFLFIEVGDGRLILVVMDSAAENAAVYAPWFRAALDSLEIWPEP